MTLAADLPKRSTTFLSRLDPRWRITGLISWTIAGSLVVSLPATLIMLTGSLVLLLVSGLSWTWMRPRLLALAPFLLLLILPLVLLQGRSGASAAMLLVVKSLALALPALVLVGMNNSSEIWDALRSLHVPGRIVSLLMLSERCGTTLAGSFNRTRRALCVRGFRWTTSPQTYRAVAAAVGTTALRGINQSQRIEWAISCRGFRGQYRSWRNYQTTWLDIGFTLCCSMLGAAVVIWDWWPRP